MSGEPVGVASLFLLMLFLWESRERLPSQTIGSQQFQPKIPAIELVQGQRQFFHQKEQITVQLLEFLYQELKQIVRSAINLCHPPFYVCSLPSPVSFVPFFYFSPLLSKWRCPLFLSTIFLISVPNRPALLVASYVPALFLKLHKNLADLVPTPSRINLSKLYLSCSEVYALSALGTIFSFSNLESSGI